MVDVATTPSFLAFLLRFASSSSTSSTSTSSSSSGSASLLIQPLTRRNIFLGAGSDGFAPSSFCL
ncbi:hypothetical protein BDW02DRAFT_570110 [Decorospora gaudefroyi]|uniref:REJ domain-containing protein n=1 Tax=Decorospora gaudefroyi TaxID=184978 RepID=A0A6A5KAL2_9PLEO|nr:hypothetical protein BDW02DRAFT_570110 [Decorospora gaudefroyi]